jgi:DNA-directed RNA polymerase subunit M/transcription elongation factor TFIIS
MLTFCEKCGNVMVLKEKSGAGKGVYECRTCGLEKAMKVNKIEIKEQVIEEPKSNFIIERLNLPTL